MAGLLLDRPGSLARAGMRRAARRTRGRVAGAGDVGGDPALRPLAGRALPGPDHGAVAGRDPSARAAEDGGQYLASVRRPLRKWGVSAKAKAIARHRGN